MYNVNFDIIIRQVLPPNKRSNSIIALLTAILKPIKYIHQLFLDYREYTVEYVSYSAQIIYLEKLLNKKFNNSLTGIYIADAISFDYLYLYNTAEQNPMYVYNTSENHPVFMRNNIEFATTIDYIVLVPSSVSYNQDEMRALINRYNNAGRRYIIQNY